MFGMNGGNLMNVIGGRRYEWHEYPAFESVITVMCLHTLKREGEKEGSGEGF